MTMKSENLNKKSPLIVDFLPAESCKFTFNKNGFLTLSLGGEAFQRVKLKRAYPYKHLEEYICVDTLDDKEIGILRSLKDLDKHSLESAREDLKERYYCPTVTKVNSIKEKMGYFYFNVIIEGKEKSFALKDITKSLRLSKENTLLIFDVEGNRYEIPNYQDIEKKSRRIIEPYLY